jgi:pyruvate dehydrogenase E2 component (dihydrolipoamide acetyltransferase)
MAKAVIMPKFEMSQEEGTVVRWLHKEGDKVEKGDVLLEVETDKVIMEVEAPVDGILAGINAHEGDTVPVTVTIAYLLKDGEELPKESKKELPVIKQKKATAKPQVTPEVERAARTAGVDLRLVKSSTSDGKITQKDVDNYLRSLKLTEAAGKVRATPAARRVAHEKGVDLSQIKGSGPHRRIQERDVLAFSMSSSTTKEEVIPLKGIRRKIAQRLQASYQTAPHIMLTLEVNMSSLLTHRKQLNEQALASGKAKISITAFLIKAVAMALKHHPWLNSSLLEDGIHLHPHTNIGMAVALDSGLIVTVIKDADKLSIESINHQIEELSSRARSNKLTPQDVTGSTFTVSNLGMYGIDHFTSIINPPESAILAVGRIVKRAVVVEEDGEDTIRVRSMMAVTLSSDHRVVDGVTAAEFLQELVSQLQGPEKLGN